MSKTKNFSQKLAAPAFNLALAGFPLWLLSYVWILFRFAGAETEVVWSIVVAGEIGAMLAGLFSVFLGLLSRRLAECGSPDFPAAANAVKLGVALWICIVFFNLVEIIFFS